MLSNKELREKARAQLKGKWTGPVMVTLVFLLICMLVSSIPVVGEGLILIASGPLLFGISRYFLNYRRDNNPQMEDLFSGFKQLGRSISLYFIMGVFIVLWSLLFIFPGIIAGIRYALAFYVLCDNPDDSALQALHRSKTLMKGNKMQLFLLWLSFVGWALCCIFTFGIGFLWLTPYMALSTINFYEALRAEPAGRRQDELSKG